MFKKVLTLVIAGLLIQAICVQPASAASKAEKQAQRTLKVREGILRLGVGEDARVALKLRDNAKLTGYVSEATNDSFVVTDAKTMAATAVANGDVTQVKGQNLSTGAKIAIGIGIGVGVTLLVLSCTSRRTDNSSDQSSSAFLRPLRFIPDSNRRGPRGTLRDCAQVSSI